MNKLAKKIIRWLASTKMLESPRRVVGEIITYAIESKQDVTTFYNDQERAKVFNLIKEIKKENEILLDKNEAYQIYISVKRTEKIKGNIAEVGVYRGGSAKLICEAKGKKNLYLFDTFEGLPELCENHDEPSSFHKGQFASSIEDVKNYLKKYSNFYIYKGLFPNTAKPIKNKKFSFVNLDVDIYESTLNCLKFFYPRMSIGGIIISHDYNTIRGVRKAVDYFFKNKPETIIELSTSQGLVVKI